MAALCLSAAACTPAGPSTPSPTPTPSASPTETQLEKQTRLDFEAAEKAYRTFSAEYDRLANAGGAKEPTQVLKDNGAGPYLAEAATVLRKQYEAKARSAGRLTIPWVKPGSYAVERLTLATCEDGSQIRVYDHGGKLIGAGKVGTLTVEVHRVDQRWKVWDTSDNTAVKSCAS